MILSTRAVTATIACGIATAIAFSCGGCAGEGTGDFWTETRPDGVVVVHNPDRSMWPSGQAWETEEVVRIGVLDGDEPYIFGSIQDVGIGKDGRIYVLDDRAWQVRIFDENGLHLRTAGRQGHGPGEFQMPWSMTWAPDGNLWVVDVGISRFTVLRPDGDFLKTYHRKIIRYGVPWGGAFARDGSLFEPGSSIDSTTGDPKEVYIRQVLREGELVTTDMFDLPSSDKPYYQVRFQGGYSNYPIPFIPSPSWVFDGDAGIWAATGEQYRFWHQTLDGRMTRIVELAREPDPVTDQDRAAARENIRHWLERMRIEGGLDQIDFSRIPSHKPAYGQIMLDDEGRIWIVQTRSESPTAGAGTPPVVFDIFDPDGRYLGPLAVTVALIPQPVITADRIGGVINNESGFQQVVVYRIRK